MSESDEKDNNSLDVKKLLSGIHLVGGALVGGSAVVTDKIMLEIQNSNDSEALRARRQMWLSILATHGRHKFYAFALALPGDKAFQAFIEENMKELDFITGTDCLLLLLGDKTLLSTASSSEKSEVFRQQIESGVALKVGNYFELSSEAYPSILLFKDFRSTDHVIIPLKDLSSDEIKQTLRHLFIDLLPKSDSLEQIADKFYVNTGDDDTSRTIYQRAKSLTTNSVRIGMQKSFEVGVEVLLKAMIGVA